MKIVITKQWVVDTDEPSVALAKATAEKISQTQKPTNYKLEVEK
jgi:predicted aspartyl protease